MRMAAAPNRTAIIWRRRLGAALRMLVACAAVGLSTLYGPHSFNRQVAFPAFSFVTAVLIVSEVTLGDAVRSTWHVMIGTSLVMGPSMMSLFLIRPERFNAELAALAVALGAFGVSLAESTPILAKRVAFGQMVIVYAGAVVLGEKTEVVMHPLHVAASTGVGALSALLALLIPFPRLATYQIRTTCKAYAENATERLNLLVKTIVDTESSEEEREPLAEIKSLSQKASRLLQSAERSQDAMLWERPQLRLINTPNFKYPTKGLQEVELTLKGMEMALASYHLKDAMNEELRHEIQTAADPLWSRIRQITHSSPSASSSTAPEILGGDDDDAREKKLSTTLNTGVLPILFILQCMNRLEQGFKPLKNKQKTAPEQNEKRVGKLRRLFKALLPTTSKQSMLFSLKCSLSLGLAVLLGLMYTKRNGIWSGLTIAISFVTSRQATFMVTNARAQGTALGSIYGVLAYFICHKYGVLKLSCIIPWVVFTTFLRHSKIYGEAGSTSAIIAALLILGRRNYGTPTEFAIARLTEAFIGLSCFIIVEILMQPERAAILVKVQVSQSLQALRSVLEEMALEISHEKSDSRLASLQEKTMEMKILLLELERLVREAKEEPNFWFTPFPGDCYTTLLESLKKMADTLFFMTYSVEVACLHLQRPEAEWKGYRAQLGADIDLFKKQIISALESIQEAMSSSNSKSRDGKEIQQNSSHDVEMGNAVPHFSRRRIPYLDKDEAEISLQSLLEQHTRHISEIGHVMENLELKKQILLSIGPIAFCMRNLVTETAEIDKMVREIIRRENLM